MPCEFSFAATDGDPAVHTLARGQGKGPLIRRRGAHRRTEATFASQRIAADSSVRVVLHTNQRTMGAPRVRLSAATGGPSSQSCRVRVP